MDLRGVAYDTGTVFTGEDSRPTWNRRQLRQELKAIDERLHANWVSVFGSEVERLTETAEEALTRGLTVSLQPRAFDRPQEYALEQLRQTARAAERLRKRHDPEVILVVGCEFMLFTPGIVPGADFYERVKNLRNPDTDWPGIHRRFAVYVDKVVTVARQNFGGRITYGAAADLEPVNWKLFDIVGLDYYSYHADPAAHTAELAPFRQWDKPILILEFGCCTFTGAAEKGGMGWNVVDYTKDPPVIPPRVERNEAEQAAPGEHDPRLRARGVPGCRDVLVHLAGCGPLGDRGVRLRHRVVLLGEDDPDGPLRPPVAVPVGAEAVVRSRRSRIPQAALNVSGSGPVRKPRSRVARSVRSASSSSKPKTSRFSAMREGVTDLGMTTLPR